jgi:hypothetical protein
MALVSQQSVAHGGTAAAGFINPALYAIGAGSNYTACFHDITSGNNTWSRSPTLFYATNNYDLCTGLGSMNGTNLINALASPIPAPSFLPATRGLRGFTLTWKTVAGITYQPQYAASLGAAPWINFGAAITATNSSASVSDSFTNAQRFYRVVALP